MAKYFVFMYVEDSWLARLFDLAIFALNPREKWPAHVTLAGPYRSRRELPRHLNFHQQVSTLGAGQFRSESQNTVFLHVGSLEMQQHIHKPDYGSAIPHLTLYNGLNHQLADKFFEKVRDLRLFMHFYATSLYAVESNKQMDFDLRSRIDLSIIQETKGMRLDDISILSDDDRIGIAIAALRESMESRFGYHQSKVVII